MKKNKKKKQKKKEHEEDREDKYERNTFILINKTTRSIIFIRRSEREEE